MAVTRPVRIGDAFDPRSNSLNAIRLLLAAAVIVAHSWPLGGYGADPGFGDQDLGDWAVAGFFAISGYLITMSRLSLKTLRDYFWRRFLRIYPGFLACMVVVAFGFAPLSVIFFSAGTYEWTGGLSYIVNNIALLVRQAGVPGTLESVPFPNAWNGPLWTLFYEFLCYIAIGLLASVISRRKLPGAVLTIFILCTVITCFYLYTAADLPQIVVRLARLGAFFCAGALVFLHKDRIPFNKGLLALSAMLVVTTMATGTFQAFAGLPVAYLMIGLGIVLPLRRMAVKNDISYGMYIYAFPVQQLLALAFPNQTLSVWLFVVLSVALTIPLAWLSWLAVEKPAMRLKKLSQDSPTKHSLVPSPGTFWMIGGLSIAIVTVTLVATLATTTSTAVGVGLAAFVIIAAWVVTPQSKNRVPKLIVLLIVAFIFSSLLPASVSLLVQGLTVVVSLIVWLQGPKDERRGESVVYAAIAILVIWAALMFHPNVPDLATGLLGFRKTAFCVAGVIAGCAIPKRMIPAYELTVVRALLLAIGVSLVAFLFVPELEAMVNRAAGEYTALFGGEKRLQGIFSGPFHAALGSMLLLGWGLVRLKAYRLTSAAAITIGTVTLYLTLVRSAYAGLAIMIVALIVIAPNFGKFVKRGLIGFILLGAGAVVVLTEVPELANTALSIFNFSEDGRFLNRLPEYAKGFEMFTQSPIVGMGAGSAGDTLDTAFQLGSHVTPHNMFLKVLVEGGIIGGAAWIALGFSILRSTDWQSEGGRLSIISIAALVGLGLTGSAIDTLPISFLVFFFAGLAVAVKPEQAVGTTTPVLGDAHMDPMKEKV